MRWAIGRMVESKYGLMIYLSSHDICAKWCSQITSIRFLETNRPRQSVSE